MGGVKTPDEWREEIRRATPRDGDLIAVALKRITDVHLAMLEELAARLEVMPPTKRGDDRLEVPPTEWKPPKDEPLTGVKRTRSPRSIALNFSNALQRIEAIPCELVKLGAVERFACLDLGAPNPCATCIAHEALES